MVQLRCPGWWAGVVDDEQDPAGLDGTRGAHVSISGISGVATKTSFALFLLYSIFGSSVLGQRAVNAKAMPGSLNAPASSGPRWAMSSAMRFARAASAGLPSAERIMTKPHI